MSKKHSKVPQWAMDIFEDRLNRSALDFDFGWYHMYAESPDEESVEMWRAKIDADTYEGWCTERDPTKQRDPITLDEFEITRL